MKKLVIIPLFLIAAGLLIYTGCKDDEQPPKVNSLSVMEITEKSAKCGGNVTGDGGASIVSRGVVWSTSEGPTVDNNEGITVDGEGIGQFTSNLTELSSNTTYYVRAYATNSAGTAYGDQVYFSTKESLKADFSSEKTTVKEGEAVDFTNNSSGDPESYEWDFGEGEGTSSEENPSHTYSSSGTYTVKLTVENSVGSDTETKTDYITVGSKPVADFSVDQTGICKGTSVQFSDESRGNPTNWEWNFGDKKESTAEDPSHTYSSEGTYTVKLTVSNEFGEDTKTKTDHITVTAPPTVDFSADKTEICEGDVVNFTDESSGYVNSWSWNFEGASSSSGIDENKEVTYNNAGTYDVELRVGNDCDSDTKTKKDYITVGASPTAGFSADQTTLKEGETVNFTNKSSGDPDGYEWDFGEGEGTSSQENPSHTYSNPGTYQVSLTATSNNCDSDTEIKGDYITVIGEEKVYAAQEKWGTGRVYLSNLEKSKHDGNLKIGAADLSGIYRSWAWFKMENIPDNAEITSIKLYIDVDEAGAKDHTLYVTDFYRKSTGDDGTTPNTLGKHWEPENISEEIGTGTIYYENDGILSSVGTKGNMNLSSLAVDDFQWKINNRDLGYEYFGIGFLEKGDDDNKAIVDGWDADNPPYIEVTYKIQ